MADVLWVVAGAALTALIVAAVGYWTAHEARDAARGGPDVRGEGQ